MNTIKSILFSSRKHAEDNPTAYLMKRLHFSNDDLALNRAGKLGESQKAELHRKFFGFVIVSAFLLPWVVMIFASMMSRIPPDQRTSHPTISVIACVIGIMVLGFFYVIYRHRKNVATAQVVALTGRVKKIPDTRQYIIMLINHHNRTERLYRVGFWTYYAFLEGETYTVYSPSFDLQTPVAAEHIPSK